MDWIAFWDKWNVWILAAGGTVATLWGLPSLLSFPIKGYDYLIWRFFGADVVDQLRKHKIQRWYQPVSVEELAKEIRRSKFLTLRSLHYLRRERQVVWDGDKWHLRNPED